MTCRVRSGPLKHCAVPVAVPACRRRGSRRRGAVGTAVRMSCVTRSETPPLQPRRKTAADAAARVPTPRPRCAARARPRASRRTPTGRARSPRSAPRSPTSRAPKRRSSRPSSTRPTDSRRVALSRIVVGFGRARNRTALRRPVRFVRPPGRERSFARERTRRAVLARGAVRGGWRLFASWRSVSLPRVPLWRGAARSRPRPRANR